MASSSVFTQLQQAGQLLEVPMDGVNIVLPGSGHIAIGTRGLNGCTCIVILGSAIIMAHISPFPGSFSESRTNIVKASRDHHDSSLKRIQELHTTYRSHFPPKSTAWGIFSVDDHGSLKPVEDQARTALRTIGYDMRLEKYREIDVQFWKPPKGELVGVMRGPARLLFLERRQLWPTVEQPTASKQSPVPKQQAPGTWWLENGSYTFYQGGRALTTQKGMPLHARIFNPVNQTVAYTASINAPSQVLSLRQILATDSGWKLEGGDFVFYRANTEANRVKIIPTLVRVVDSANRRVLFHNGKTLQSFTTMPESVSKGGPAKADDNVGEDAGGDDNGDDDEAEESDKDENDDNNDDDDDDTDDDDDDDDEGSEDDEDDDDEERDDADSDEDAETDTVVLRSPNSRVPQQSSGRDVQGSHPSARGAASTTQRPSGTTQNQPWVFNGRGYFRVDGGGNPIGGMTANPPVNVNIFNTQTGGTVKWNGSKWL